MPNRLADETSPYLLQHANNPVDWHPWGPEALELARSENKPILLSIGYSACHWCHVMERESFCNDDIAALMNESFVNIKVDREERPDLDEVYMRSVQAFQHGRGGWPMTVFLTPDGKPFFGGTYYPPRARDGMPGLVDVLGHMSRLWSDDPSRVGEITQQMHELLATGSDLPEAEAGSARWLDPVAIAAAGAFDTTHGGFGPAPKFPPHGTLAVLLAHGRATASDPSFDMALHTLERMAQVGFYDLLGGGFSRYSVDTEWRVPHFEKMLYDNAQLIPLYVDAWRLTGKERYERVVRKTIGWALREMQLDEGGFAASQDADTEGEEGRFFSWTHAQLEGVLGPDDAARLAGLIGVTDSGTFEHGTSVLRLERPIHQLDLRERALVERSLIRLFRVRRLREAPERDDKVVTAWNGLMISALAKASAALDEPEWAVAATLTARFLLQEATVDGRLMRTSRDGKAHIPAYADDHAALLLGLLDLYEATLDPTWLDEANRLADTIVRLFWDTDGGLFYTGSDQPQLVVRSKNALGGAEPSANGMAALAFARMAVLLERDDLGAHADAILRRLAPFLDEAPRALGAEALAGAWRGGQALQIAVVGTAEAAAPLLQELQRHHLPFAVVAGGPPGALPEQVPWLADKDAGDAEAAVYVCEGSTCQLPATTPAMLAETLRKVLRPWPATATHASKRPPAPNLPLPADAWVGEVLDPESFAGKVLVIGVFTSSRVGSQMVLPGLQALHEDFADQAVAVVGVHSAKFPGEQDRAQVAAALARAHVSFPVVFDPDRTVYDALTARTWPTFVVIDAQGRVAFRRAGEMTADSLAPLIRQLLAEEATTGRLTGPLAYPDRRTSAVGPLYFPQRVHVFPDALMQEMGADALHGGLLYIADTGTHRVLELELDAGPDGWPVANLIRVFGTGEAGLQDGEASEATFSSPHGLCRSTRDLFVADTGNHCLRAIDLDTGVVRTIAGTGAFGRGRPRGRLLLNQPTQMALRAPIDVEVLESKGTALVFVAMAGAQQVWAWAEGHLGLFAGSGREEHVDGPAADAALAQPSGLVLFGRYLLFVDAETSSIRGVDLQHHQVVTVVGQGLNDFGDRDGRGEAVRLQHPQDLTFLGESVYLADTLNHKVKRIELATLDTRTVAGGDGSLRSPGGIDRLGDFLVVADTDHHQIKIVHHETGEVRELPITVRSAVE